MTVLDTRPQPSDAAAPSAFAQPGGPLDPGLLEAIGESAAAADHAGDLVGSHDRMVDEGLFHLLVPRQLGGSEGSVVEWFDTAMTVAEVDAAAGWIMAQGAVQTGWIAASGSAELAAEFFQRRQTIATSSAGNATAERQGDSYVVRDARWAYVSGCQGAAFLGGMVRTTTEAGAPESRMVLVPAADATIVPTWDTLGLRGTGSHHIDLGAELTVPANRTFTWPSLTITRPGPFATFATHTVSLISLSAAAVNLGAARRAIAEATTSAEHKVHRFDTVPVIQQSPFVRGIAELHGQVELATAGVRALVERMWGTRRRRAPADPRAAGPPAARRRGGDPGGSRRRPIGAGADGCRRAPSGPPTRTARARHPDAAQPRRHEPVEPRAARQRPAGHLPGTALVHLTDAGAERAGPGLRGGSSAGRRRPRSSCGVGRCRPWRRSPMTRLRWGPDTTS